MDLKRNECKQCIKCSNTSSKYPHKVFVRVPTDVEKRINWLQLASIDPQSLAGQSIIYMCEDHFDIEDCATNYMQYKLGSEELIIKDNAVPTKFRPDPKTSSKNSKPKNMEDNAVPTKFLPDPKTSSQNSKPEKSGTRKSKRLRQNLAANSVSLLSQPYVEEIKKQDALQPAKRRLSENDDDDDITHYSLSALAESSESTDELFDNIGKTIVKKLKSMSLENAVSVLKQIVAIINKTPSNYNETTSNTAELRKIRKVSNNEDFRSPVGEVTSKGSSINSFQVMSLPTNNIQYIQNNPQPTIQYIQTSPHPTIQCIETTPQRTIQYIQSSPQPMIQYIQRSPQPPTILSSPNSVQLMQGNSKKLLEPTDGTKRIVKVDANSVPTSIRWITSLLKEVKPIDPSKFEKVESISSPSQTVLEASIIKHMEETPEASTNTIGDEPQVVTIHHPLVNSDHNYSIPAILEPDQPDNACVVYIMDNNNKVITVKELLSNQVMDPKTVVETLKTQKVESKSAASNKLTGVKKDTTIKRKRKKRRAKRLTFIKKHKTSQPKSIENVKAVKIKKEKAKSVKIKENVKLVTIKEEKDYYDYSTDTASIDDYCSDRLNDSLDDFSEVICKFEPEEEALVKSEPESDYDDPMAFLEASKLR